MGDRQEDIKVVQELMRHSSSKLTLDIYQQGAVAAKRLAINIPQRSSQSQLPDPSFHLNPKGSQIIGSLSLACNPQETC
jgi:hypothetical protein